MSRHTPARLDTSRAILLPVVAWLVASLAACASGPAPTPAPAPAPDGTPSPAGMQCHADAAGAAIGQQPSAAVVARARTDAGARTTRVLHPGQPATMDFRQDRLNIRLDDDGVVKSLDCG